MKESDFKIGTKVKIFIDSNDNRLTEPEHGVIVSSIDAIGVDFNPSNFPCVRFPNGQWSGVNYYMYRDAIEIDE
jgi:hypothetical protein